MIDTKSLIYTGLCLAAIIAAGHFPSGQRKLAAQVAVAIVAEKLFLRWLGWGAVLYWLDDVGVHLRSMWFWAPADALIGIYALSVGRRYWWAWAVWSVTVVQCCFHSFYEFGLFPYAGYEFWLDKLLLSQVAVFFLGGGKGVMDRVGRLVRSNAHGRGILRGASARSLQSWYSP